MTSDHTELVKRLRHEARVISAMTVAGQIPVERVPLEAADAIEEQAANYEIGYSAGESSQLADWEVALDGLLPDDVGCRPLEVAAWITRRLAERDEDGGTWGA